MIQKMHCQSLSKKKASSSFVRIGVLVSFLLLSLAAAYVNRARPVLNASIVNFAGIVAIWFFYASLVYVLATTFVPTPYKDWISSDDDTKSLNPGGLRALRAETSECRVRSSLFAFGISAFVIASLWLFDVISFLPQ